MVDSRAELIDALGGDAAQPVRLLLRGASHPDGVGAQGRGQHRGGDAEVQGRHGLAQDSAAAAHIQHAAA